MQRAANRTGSKTARWGTVATIVLLAAACAPPTTPTAPAPTPTPVFHASGLNAVFLAAPTPRVSLKPLVGRYQLEIDAGERSGSSCPSLPAEATRRVYTADIDDLGGRYGVKLYDAAFLADSAQVGYGCLDPRLPQSGHAACHQFLLTGDADAITVTAQSNNEGRGSEIWEALSDGFVLAITGTATGMKRDGRIEATGTGSLWHGNGLPATTSHSCQSAALKFTFSPR